MAYSDRALGTAGGLPKETKGDADLVWSEFARSQRVKTQRVGEHDAVFYEGDTADRVYELIEDYQRALDLMPEDD